MDMRFEDMSWMCWKTACGLWPPVVGGTEGMFAGAPRGPLLWPKFMFECAVPEGRDAHSWCVAGTLLVIPKGVLGASGSGPTPALASWDFWRPRVKVASERVCLDEALGGKVGFSGEMVAWAREDERGCSLAEFDDEERREADLRRLEPKSATEEAKLCREECVLRCDGELLETASDSSMGGTGVTDRVGWGVLLRGGRSAPSLLRDLSRRKSDGLRGRNEDAPVVEVGAVEEETMMPRPRGQGRERLW